MAIAVIALVCLLWWRRRRQVSKAFDNSVPEPLTNTPQPFPRGDRPDIWYKGMVEVPQPVTIVVPATGKRAQMEGRMTASTTSQDQVAGQSSGPGPVTVLTAIPPPPAPASSATNASANDSVVPPSTAATSPSTPRSREVDVNQIIELIAQRIDPAPRVSRSDSDAPPPRYPS